MCVILTSATGTRVSANLLIRFSL